MKRILIALALCLVVVGTMAAPALATAQKVDLVPCPFNYPDPAAPPPGGAFVVFNNSAGPTNLEVTVSLKGVKPNTEYDIWLGADDWYATRSIIGTVKTNGQGNANVHTNTKVVSGTHTLAIDVGLKGSFLDIYETAGIHDSPMGGVTLTFK